MQKEFDKHAAALEELYESAKENMLRIPVSNDHAEYQNELFKSLQGMKVFALDALKREQHAIDLIENSMSSGVLEINAESLRVVNEHGFTPEHDQKFDQGQLLYAAQAYMESGTFDDGPNFPSIWPLPEHRWKPSTKDRVRELAKAGAFIVSEIRRIKFMESNTKMEVQS